MLTYTCAERDILYHTDQEMAIWKSIVTLIYRELLALDRKIDIFKLIYRYLLVFGR
jgi:predicted transglutaminase-like protease